MWHCACRFLSFYVRKLRSTCQTSVAASILLVAPAGLFTRGTVGVPVALHTVLTTVAVANGKRRDRPKRDRTKCIRPLSPSSSSPSFHPINARGRLLPCLSLSTRVKSRCNLHNYIGKWNRPFLFLALVFFSPCLRLAPREVRSARIPSASFRFFILHGGNSSALIHSRLPEHYDLLAGDKLQAHTEYLVAQNIPAAAVRPRILARPNHLLPLLSHEKPTMFHAMRVARPHQQPS